MKKLLIIPIIFILSVLIASAQTSVTKSNFKITADKETYFCEPVYSDNGCLITGQITFENDNI